MNLKPEKTVSIQCIIGVTVKTSQVSGSREHVLVKFLGDVLAENITVLKAQSSEKRYAFVEIVYQRVGAHPMDLVLLSRTLEYIHLIVCI